MKNTLTYRHDAYTAARGRPSILKIDCEACRGFVALYQKDGPGPLKRMYADRIVAPAALIARIHGKKKFTGLVCSHCGETLAVAMTYEKEKRPAFRLFQSAVTKKKLTLKQASSKRYN